MFVFKFFDVFAYDLHYFGVVDELLIEVFDLFDLFADSVFLVS